ncbi:MAG: hypothetical protein ACLVL2_08235 [Bacteroides cellulosilyticus]
MWDIDTPNCYVAVFSWVFMDGKRNG